MYIKTKLCPVCHKQFVAQGLKNHIINTAKSEVWNNLKKKPHTIFFRKHKFSLPHRDTLSFYRIK